MRALEAGMSPRGLEAVSERHLPDQYARRGGALTIEDEGRYCHRRGTRPRVSVSSLVIPKQLKEEYPWQELFQPYTQTTLKPLVQCTIWSVRGLPATISV